MARIHPNFLKAYMEYTLNSEAPDTFHFWTGVSCVAGALRRRVWIDCKFWDWVPNFYIFFVAPPGIVSKSTTADIGMNLLKKVPKIKFGPSAVTWQMLVQQMAGISEAFTDNQGKFHKMSAVTVVASELGNFIKPQDTDMIDALVALWDGQRGEFTKATKTQGQDRILNAWLNIIGCTTPAWISSAFPEYMIGGGFTSRALFIYADKKRKLVAYPGREITPYDTQLAKELIADLTDISMMAGEMILTPEAYELGEEWYNEFHTNRPKHLDNEHFGGYIARKQTHVHKLAMILSASESNELYITPEHLQQAIAIVTSLEADMPRVFNKVGHGQQSRKAMQLRAVIKLHKEIKQSDLLREAQKLGITFREFEDLLKGSVAAKQITKLQKGSVMYIKALDS